jgi:hypothetical protein
MTVCGICHWIQKYREGELTATVRQALVKAEVDHKWRHHGEIKA